MRAFLALIVLAAISYSTASSAFVTVCNNEPDFRNDEFFENKENHRLIKSEVGFDCLAKKQLFSVRLTTIGPGLQFQGIEGLVITCPLVSVARLNKRIEKKGYWSAVGVAASASTVFGVRAGVALNHRGALCTITGGSLMSFGVAAGAINIEIY